MRVWQRGSVWVLGVAMLCATPLAAQEDSAGSAACASCHKDLVENYAGSPHGGRAPARHVESVTCESCHGPGAAHAKNGAVSLIFDPARAPAKDVDAKCLQCHEVPRPHYANSSHGRSNVSCIGCHTIHAPGSTKYLLKVKQPELCVQCHSGVKAQFAAPLHHKVQEGLIDCTDCHDAHGAVGEVDLSSATSEFAICTKCHAATAGPFLYEHAPVKSEGCTGCHFPHGGPNPDLLIATRVNTLCLQCHLPSSAVPAHVQSAQSQPCVGCHVSIHGSNISPVFQETGGKKSEP